MTELMNFAGVAEIGNEGIKKHFENIDLWEPLFELVWNGFDAKAQNVAVVLSENDLRGVDKVAVLDDGEGIDYTKLPETFGRFNDSSKKADVALHGSHGRGRLAFHRVCRNAAWYTRSTKGDAVIEVNAATIKDYSGRVLVPALQCAMLQNKAHGTLVELCQFTVNLPELDALREKFSIEFGWFLAVRPEKYLTVNEKTVTVPKNEVTSKTISINGYNFSVQVIRWESKPASEKSFTYLMNGKGELVYKVLSTLNNKPNFYTSVCVSSLWADKFSQHRDLLNQDAHTPASRTWQKLLNELRKLTDSIYEEFLRKMAEKVVQGYEDAGYFPTYVGLDAVEKAWRQRYVRELIKQIYIADPQVFHKAAKKQLKIIIRLLDRISVSNENDALFEVLNGALDLSDESMKRLADQLQQTSLENIVASIEVLQRRALAVQKLRFVMNERYRTVLETPDLQQIIENNTWLFGPKYETIGAEEDSFTKVAKKLRDSTVGRSLVDEDDVEESGDLVGAQRQTDLFLARKLPTYDSRGQQIYKCIVIEIKRPAISLNKKHLRQLEDYADIIKKYPEFTSTKMHFELILVGRQISSADEQIKSRLNSLIPRGEQGLVSDDPRMKLYVLNWYSLLDSFELSNDFMLEHLKLKRAKLDDATKEELVADLQQAH